MLQESLDRLVLNPNGIYLDLTFGGGGHSKKILERLEEDGRLCSFDQDADAQKNAKEIIDSSFTFIKANFRYFQKYLKLYGVNEVDGILADLGVSSYQFDEPSKGFSTRFDGPLDMRMDQNSSKTAADVLNQYSEKELHRIFGLYGEVRNAKTLASAVCAERINTSLESIAQFKALLAKYAKKGKENKYYAQVFQALRIEVNDEMKALEEMLENCSPVIKAGGRLVVLTYHSLEDRVVKNYINKGNIEGKIEQDFYGNVLRPFEPLFNKPMTASQEELAVNNRARSAKLRVGVKV